MTLLEEAQAKYADYPEMPYISPDRDLAAWLEEVDMSSGKLVPRRNMQRTPDGLLPGDIIILWRIAFGTYTNETVISKYFEYIYGIDAKAHMQDLLEAGLVIEESAMESMDHLTAGFLKKALKPLKIPGMSSMSKEELVAAVQKNMTEEAFGALFSVRGYRLTPKGQASLDANQYVIDKHPKKKM